MTVPALRSKVADPLTEKTDVLVLGVRPGEDGPELASTMPGFEDLAGRLKDLGVTGEQDEVRRLAGIGEASTIALVGLGRGEVSSNTLRYAAGSATRQVTGVKTITLALPVTDEEEVTAVLEGAAMGAYSFTRYRSKPGSAPAEEITVLSDSEVADSVLERVRVVIEAVNQVRDLVNLPPNDLYPESFTDAVLELSAEDDVEVTVLAEEELREGGYGGIAGVGSGSVRGPRLVKISYTPAQATKHLALVGKGITFDSGGLSIKPGASMVGMKYDMTGAATVMAVALAAARLALPVRVTAWLCLAENMPSGSAVRPNDVLTTRNGKTVEVLNTDAEGRLVLADGLAAASEEAPDAIVDVATLTGAAIVALGHRHVGVMGENALTKQVVEIADTLGEAMWAMPLPEDLRSMLNSDIADIANAKIGSSAGGMLLAGLFLREFIGSTEEKTPIPWAHLDIAGPANNTVGGFGFTGKGPTGIAVRTLLTLAEDFSRP